jgi:hypothetical protein
MCFIRVAVTAAIAARVVLAQIPDANSTGQPGGPDAIGTQGSAIPNVLNPNLATPSKNPANQNQPIPVNPFTGLTSVSSQNYRPLTGEQRWKLYWKQNYLSVGAYFGPLFTAVVFDQATGSTGDWGSGLGGFGCRLGSRIAVSTIQGTLQASSAAAFHEDVRYIASSATGFKKRALHAIAFSFLTFNNQGHTTLNISNLTSYYGATAASTAWVPIHGKVGTYILTNGTEQIGISVPMNLLHEFWPEVRRKILRRP